jgi:hypothetical protein
LCVDFCNNLATGKISPGIEITVVGKFNSRDKVEKEPSRERIPGIVKGRGVASVHPPKINGRETPRNALIP